MDTELVSRLAAQDMKLEEIRIAVQATRKYMQITFWVTIVLFVLPLIGILYAVPKAMNSYTSSLNIDGLEVLQGL